MYALLTKSKQEYDCNNNISKPVPPMAVVSTGPITRNYILGKEMLEKGRWGRVMAAKDRVTGEDRAVRRIKLGKDMNLDMIRKLVKPLLIPRHPNIVKYQGASVTEKELCLTMTLSNCPLTKVIPLALNQLLFTCKEVVNGLSYLHKKGMVHGAVRASNVLLDKDGRARLGDWGLQVVERGRILQWEAPEVRGGGMVTKQSDIWSLGVLVVECARGSLPYQSYRVASPLSLLGQDKVTADCCSLVGDCLVTQPGDRPGIEMVSRHKYLGGITVDRVVGRQMVAVGGMNVKQKVDMDSHASARDKLDCGKCGESTDYSPVFMSEGGSTPFVCDNCVELEGGHQDCEVKECETCRGIGRVLRTRWKRQDNLDKLVGSKMEELYRKNKRMVTSTSEDHKDVASRGSCVANTGSLGGNGEERMFDVLMEGVKVMQARMLTQGVLDRKCEVCSMCGDQFNIQSGEVSVNGDYFCQPCVGQLAKEDV